MVVYDFVKSFRKVGQWADMSKMNGYKPTEAEVQLAQVLMQDSDRPRKVKEICAEAGIVTGTYYTAMKKPAFLEYLKSLKEGTLTGYLMPSFHALGKKAAEGSFQHIQYLHQLLGIYTAAPPEQIRETRTSEELRSTIKNLLQATGSEPSAPLKKQEKDSTGEDDLI